MNCKLPKTKINAALFHDGICRMTGFDFGVDRYTVLCDWAIPNIVIALAMPQKSAAILGKDFPDFLFIFCHQIASFS